MEFKKFSTIAENELKKIKGVIRKEISREISGIAALVSEKGSQLALFGGVANHPHGEEEEKKKADIEGQRK